jgi:hypothetical protein
MTHWVFEVDSKKIAIERVTFKNCKNRPKMPFEKNIHLTQIWEHSKNVIVYISGCKKDPCHRLDPTSGQPQTGTKNPPTVEADFSCTPHLPDRMIFFPTVPSNS